MSAPSQSMDLDEVAMASAPGAAESVVVEEQRSHSAGPGDSNGESQPQMFRSLSFDAVASASSNGGRDSPEPVAAPAPMLFVPFDPAEVAFLSSSHQGREVEGKMKKNRVRFRSALVDPLTSAFLREERFRKAANTSDAATVERLLGEGVNVNCADEKKRTALHFASCKGDREVLQLLLSHKANVNVRDCNNNTPLHLAACTNHIEIITLLLRAGTDLTARDNNNRIPLHYALSRLQFLERARGRMSANERKGGMYEVVELFREFMRLSGDPSCDDQLTQLADRMQTVTTVEEVDAIGSLLQNLTTMTLGRYDS